MINEDNAKNPEGFNMLKMLAEEGDLEAQTNLVFMYCYRRWCKSKFR